MNKGFLQNERRRAEVTGEAVQPADHPDGCACDKCMPGTRTTDIIAVGLPFVLGYDAVNGYANAQERDGEVWLTVKGFGLGELSMPKAEATALRDQLTKAIEQL